MSAAQCDFSVRHNYLISNLDLYLRYVYSPYQSGVLYRIGTNVGDQSKKKHWMFQMLFHNAPSTTSQSYRALSASTPTNKPAVNLKTSCHRVHRFNAFPSLTTTAFNLHAWSQIKFRNKQLITTVGLECTPFSKPAYWLRQDQQSGY